jgi:hypothetical protein
MLSELRPLEQQIFLRNVWDILKPGGKLIIAAEFFPKGLHRIKFQIKRAWYKLKLKKRFSTQPLQLFEDYLEPIGFKKGKEKSWTGGSIRAIIMQKQDPQYSESISSIQSGSGYYFPKERKFSGISAILGIWRCILTGQVDHVPIEPGLYQIGNPTSQSPIIVSSNYLYTYIKIRGHLKSLNLWLLCVDSMGINVWCAARGNNFGNKQILEAVHATGVNEITSKKELILPQLSAGGVERPKLKKKLSSLGIKVTYGPVWARHLPDYLEDRPIIKPAKMKLAKFTMYHRLRAGITHTTFLLRKIFLYPILLSLILVLFINQPRYWSLFLDLCSSLLFANAILTLLFPIANFTRKFIHKGIFFGIINIGVSTAFSVLLLNNPPYSWFNLLFYFWVSFFTTMSFSGYSFSTSPREIGDEYNKFAIINRITLILGVLLVIVGILLNFN